LCQGLIHPPGLRAAVGVDLKLQVKNFWKSFSIAYAKPFIKAAMDELNKKTFNACWKNVWSKAVKDFKGFPGSDGKVKKIIQTEREVGGEGFVDTIDEVEEHTEEQQKVLTNEELEDLVKSSTEQ
jgi:hypothetical protein